MAKTRHVHTLVDLGHELSLWLCLYLRSVYIYVFFVCGRKGEACDLRSVRRKSTSVGRENAVLELRFRERTSQVWVEMLRP
jgi:hypothetical protein